MSLDVTVFRLVSRNTVQGPMLCIVDKTMQCLYLCMAICYRDVTIYRLVSKNTVEEAMLRSAQAKLQLEQDVTGQTEGKIDRTGEDSNSYQQVQITDL